MRQESTRVKSGNSYRLGREDAVPLHATIQALRADVLEAILAGRILQQRSNKHRGHVLNTETLLS